MAHGFVTLLFFYSLALLFASVFCFRFPFFFNLLVNTHTTYSSCHTYKPPVCSIVCTATGLHDLALHHVMQCATESVLYLTSSSIQVQVHDYPRSATLNELRINRCLCEHRRVCMLLGCLASAWVLAHVLFLSVCVCARITPTMPVHSALTSP